MKQKRWLLFILLLLLALALAGCGVTGQDIDIREDAPEGFWQTLVVWPLATGLLWLNDALVDMNFPYHWGFAIILFTLFTRIVMFPLTLTQIRGMEAQKKIQPKIQELQKKYGKDREKMAQEQMKLYKEAGVNPLSGCLPLLVQMPILFGLYSALVVLGNELSESPFFWIPDLAFPSYTGGMSWIAEDFSGGRYGHLLAYLILPILLMVSQFVMQKWMTPATPTTGDNSQANMMKQMTYMMTFMFGFFTLQVPAGLSLYWVTSNLLQMLQQWAITSERFNLSKVNLPTLSTVDEANESIDSSTNGTTPSSAVTKTTVTAPSKAQVDAGSSKKPSRRRGKRK